MRIKLIGGLQPAAAVGRAGARAGTGPTAARGLYRHLRAIIRPRVLVFSILGFTAPGMHRWIRY